MLGQRRGRIHGVRTGSLRFLLARPERMATRISRFQMPLEILVAVLIGAAFTELLAAFEAETWLTGLILVASSLMIAVAILLARRSSIDFGFCLIAFDPLSSSGQQPRGRSQLSQALSREGREWTAQELLIPAERVSEWLDRTVAHTQQVFLAARDSAIGTPRSAVVPYTIDVMSFFWAAKMSPQLQSAQADIFEVNQNGESRDWTRLMSVSPTLYRDFFSHEDSCEVAAGQGVVVYKQNKLPRTAWKDGVPAFSRWFPSSGLPDAVVPIDCGVPVEVSERAVPRELEIEAAKAVLDAAVRVRTIARRNDSDADQATDLYLQCGQACAFALGLLLSGLTNFRLMRWDGSVQEWRVWAEL